MDAAGPLCRFGGADERRDRLRIGTDRRASWCAGRDLNPHGIATTSPSNWRVCHSTTRALDEHDAYSASLRVKRRILKRSYREPKIIATSNFLNVSTLVEPLLSCRRRSAAGRIISERSRNRRRGAERR